MREAESRLLFSEPFPLTTGSCWIWLACTCSRSRSYGSPRRSQRFLKLFSWCLNPAACGPSPLPKRDRTFTVWWTHTTQTQHSPTKRSTPALNYVPCWGRTAAAETYRRSRDGAGTGESLKLQPETETQSPLRYVCQTRVNHRRRDQSQPRQSNHPETAMPKNSQSHSTRYTHLLPMTFMTSQGGHVFGRVYLLVWLFVSVC